MATCTATSTCGSSTMQYGPARGWEGSSTRRSSQPLSTPATRWPSNCTRSPGLLQRGLSVGRSGTFSLWNCA
eukprot:2882348-Pyramimonas_sp.AAC.1